MEKPYYAMKTLFPPTLLTTPLEGKRFAVSGSTWIPVDETVTMQMLFDAWEPLYPKPKFYNVPSEHGSHSYLASVFPGGIVKCTCWGFIRHKNCYHSRNLKSRLNLV
jgi:hypothetical protein